MTTDGQWDASQSDGSFVKRPNVVSGGECAIARGPAPVQDDIGPTILRQAIRRGTDAMHTNKSQHVLKPHSPQE